MFNAQPTGTVISRRHGSETLTTARKTRTRLTTKAGEMIRAITVNTDKVCFGACPYCPLKECLTCVNKHPYFVIDFWSTVNHCGHYDRFQYTKSMINNKLSQELTVKLRMMMATTTMKRQR